jgi:hypothetical protein
VETILYTRDHGPQCLVARIIFQHDTGESFVKQLQSCGLTWYWHSVREEGHKAVRGQPDLPRYRPLTLLTDQNWNDLALDVEEHVVSLGNDEEDPDDFEFRNLMFFGLKGKLAEPIERDLDEVMRRFLQDPDPLELVFDRTQDVYEENVFFRHEPGSEVRCLFDAWQLDPLHPSKVRPYQKLRSVQLESIYAGMKNWYR